MWTAENRARYDRSRLRYPSDLTDEEWALISPRIPPARRGGTKRTVNLREIVNGLMYILGTGCQWRAIPKDLPPRSTLYDYFDLWSWDGTLDRIHHALYVECRERAGQPSASSEPSEGSLDDPAFGQDDETVDFIGTFDDFDIHTLQDTSKTVLEACALISAIGVELEKEGIEAEQGGHEEHATIAILDVRGMHDGVHQQALRVDENVPLLALDLLARIISMRIVRPPFSALFTLWLSMIAAVGDASRAKDWECLNRKALTFVKLASIRIMLRKLCNPR